VCGVGGGGSLFVFASFLCFFFRDVFSVFLVRPCGHAALGIYCGLGSSLALVLTVGQSHTHFSAWVLYLWCSGGYGFFTILGGVISPWRVVSVLAYGCGCPLFLVVLLLGPYNYWFIRGVCGSDVPLLCCVGLPVFLTV